MNFSELTSLLFYMSLFVLIKMKNREYSDEFKKAVLESPIAKAVYSAYEKNDDHLKLIEAITLRLVEVEDELYKRNLAEMKNRLVKYSD